MKKILLLLTSLFLFSLGKAQTTLISRAPFPGLLRVDAADFVIGNKAYLGTGWCDSTYTGSNDFWEYDAQTDVWTQKASFPGTQRTGAVGFAIGNKGYIATGIYDVNWTSSFNDIWEYDPTFDSWTQKTSMPAAPRDGAVAFVINNIAYIGCGKNGIASTSNDFWAYNPATDTWQQKASFPNPAIRHDAFAFSIGSNGYVGGGWDFIDFYEYNSINDTWTQKNNLLNYPNEAAGVTGFSHANTGYIIGGYWSPGSTYIQKYDSTNDTWSIVYNSTLFPPYYTMMLFGTSVFVINNIPFLTQGEDNGNQFYPGTYEINLVNSVDNLNAETFISISPNPSTTEVTINFGKATRCTVQLHNTLGEMLQQTQTNSATLTLNMSNKPKGIYFVTVTDEAGNKTVKKIVKM